MATQGDMKARIARELARSNLTQEISDAIATAIGEYSKERFRFSETIPGDPPTFNTTAGQWIYTDADQPVIGSLWKIDYVIIYIGNTTASLLRIEPEAAKLYNQQGTMVGQPAWYAYEGNELLISPIPDQAYLIELGLFNNIPAPVDDSIDGNPWMNDAELLIRSRAKYEISVHKTRNATMAQAMSPDAPDMNGGVAGAAFRAYKSLKGATNRVTALGRVRPMRF